MVDCSSEFSFDKYSDSRERLGETDGVSVGNGLYEKRDSNVERYEGGTLGLPPISVTDVSGLLDGLHVEVVGE